MDLITYRTGYKYQLVADYTVVLSFVPPAPIMTEYIDFAMTGRLMIRKGYAWDGPSGPTIDSKNFMRGSLVHDALYQLMRQRHLDHDQYRMVSDQVLKALCLEDGMSEVRAAGVYHGVRLGGGPSADPANDKKIVTAP